MGVVVWSGIFYLVWRYLRHVETKERQRGRNGDGDK
jgi:hypothetical protein